MATSKFNAKSFNRYERNMETCFEKMHFEITQSESSFPEHKLLHAAWAWRNYSDAIGWASK
jgi:hypothetical protein